MENVKNQTKLIEPTTLISWFICLILGSALTFATLALLNRVQPASIVIQPPAATATPQPTATPAPIRIYVNGQVKNPAVYTLPPGAIVQEAIAQAGGFTPQALTDPVNLALPLTDGMHIYVPHQDEAAQLPQVVSSSPPAGVSSSPGSPAGLVNLNTATLEQLDTLPGIGPSTAQKIVEYREANGSFATIEAIMDVPGIGPAKFEQLKTLITVQ
jgi:competence protein ComEA